MLLLYHSIMRFKWVKILQECCFTDEERLVPVCMYMYAYIYISIAIDRYKNYNCFLPFDLILFYGGGGAGDVHISP